MEITGNKIFYLTKKELDAIHKGAAEIGAKTALAKLDEEKKKQNHKVKDRRLHNTKLLLENYHMLKLSATESVYERSQINESIADIVLSMMDIDNDDIIVESIKRSAERTIIMVEHIDTMLNLYEIFCNKSGDWKDKRRYEVISNLYIIDEIKTVREVAQEQNVSIDTVYSDIKVAVQRLSALIFGIDGLKIM